ncbi:hypothetical protein TNCV_4460561 [Trichonephila clavipes]|nr:hypothetical protein TNCV_4460561 [Trichonephila clavipes]
MQSRKCRSCHLRYKEAKKKNRKINKLMAGLTVKQQRVVHVTEKKQAFLEDQVYPTAQTGSWAYLIRHFNKSCPNFLAQHMFLHR